MNLKKTDKIIAVLGVVILIIAAIGIVFLVEDQEENDDDDNGKDSKTDGFLVTWETQTGSTTEKGKAGEQVATGSFTLDIPENAVLTNVDVNIKWTDDKGLLGSLKLPIGNIGRQMFGKDTLKATVTAPDGTIGEYSGQGGIVNKASVETFTINSPTDETLDLKNEEEVKSTINDMYSFESNLDYKVTVDAKGLTDKGNDFTFMIDYSYAVYTIGDEDKTTDDDQDDDNENNDEQETMADIIKNMGSGFRTFY